MDLFLEFLLPCDLYNVFLVFGGLFPLVLCLENGISHFGRLRRDHGGRTEREKWRLPPTLLGLHLHQIDRNMPFPQSWLPWAPVTGHFPTLTKLIGSVRKQKNEAENKMGHLTFPYSPLELEVPCGGPQARRRWLFLQLCSIYCQVWSVEFKARYTGAKDMEKPPPVQWCFKFWSLPQSVCHCLLCRVLKLLLLELRLCFIAIYSGRGRVGGVSSLLPGTRTP